jgi:hypothetical protein
MADKAHTRSLIIQSSGWHLPITVVEIVHGNGFDQAKRKIRLTLDIFGHCA